VLIVRAVGCGDAKVETVEGFLRAVQLGERLGGHLVGRDIVGVVVDEGGEFGEGGVGLSLADVLHGEAIAGEGVGGVGVEDFGEGCDLVHLLMVLCCGSGWQVGCVVSAERKAMQIVLPRNHPRGFNSARDSLAI
jgi:hypothetical protein